MLLELKFKQRNEATQFPLQRRLRSTTHRWIVRFGSQKLARLLLSWSGDVKTTKTETSIKLPLTHEEIAEFIGTTRETVTRTLSEFKNLRLVAVEGSSLMISNRQAPETLGCD